LREVPSSKLKAQKRSSKLKVQSSKEAPNSKPQSAPAGPWSKRLLTAGLASQDREDWNVELGIYFELGTLSLELCFNRSYGIQSSLVNRKTRAVHPEVDGAARGNSR
jgi:hypothetical protein